jgi:predicted small lipoprotein YifL
VRAAPGRNVVALAVAVALAAPLAGCAKKAPPEPPAGKPDTSNRVYPSE